MQQQLSLKPAHKIVQEYYKAIAVKKQMLLFHEGNVAPAFARLLSRCGAQFSWKLVEQYGAAEITKWDIFYYVYALLHQPAYRQKYAANLNRDLPHLPFVASVETFLRYVAAGKRLAELHVHYEEQPEYPLEMIENPAAPLDWRVKKMRLSKDKTEIQYNNFLTLRGIPAAVFEYRLGNRSALDWLIDQYRLTADPRSKIVNDPNNPDDPQYILRLFKKVVTVSLETVNIVKQLTA